MAFDVDDIICYNYYQYFNWKLIHPIIKPLKNISCIIIILYTKMKSIKDKRPKYIFFIWSIIEIITRSGNDYDSLEHFAMTVYYESIKLCERVISNT